MNKATKWFYFAKRHKILGRLVIKLMRVFFSCDIPKGLTIGENCVFEHNALGVVISREVIVGDNCRIYQGVTIGAGAGGYPKIGNNVTIFPNSTIAGGIVIGDNSVIGANSFVNKDVPENTVMGGVPARILKEKGK